MNPLCRYFVLCADGHVTLPGDRVVVEEPNGPGFVLAEDPAGSEIILAQPLHALDAVPGPKYPSYIEGLTLFAQLTGATGTHRLSVELIRWHQAVEYRVFQTSETLLGFGTSRVNVRQYYVRFSLTIFPVAAQYSFRLHCNGQEIGQAEVELR